MPLSADQEEFVVWFNDNKDEKCLKLSGHAGSGKTYIMGHLNWTGRVVFCAPSHQAKNILSGKVKGDVFTTASALGILPKTIDGKMQFLKQRDGHIEQIKRDYPQMPLLVVVDEGSMVSTYQIQLLLQSPADIILFVGDKAQLPPVGELIAPIYSDDADDIPNFDLTTMHRQAEGSPILTLARMVREGKHFDPAVGVPHTEMSEETITKFYTDHSDGMVICPTHNTKDMANHIARTVNNDGKPPVKRFIKGERLFLESSVAPPSGPTNGDTVSIITEPKKGEFLGFKIWSMEIRDDLGDEWHVRVPMDINVQKEVTKKLSRLAHDYRIAFDDEKKKQINEMVEKLNEGISFASHGYAMTIHKSQGSTIRNVFLCIPSHDMQYFEDERTKMIYTGITRASEYLLLGT